MLRLRVVSAMLLAAALFGGCSGGNAGGKPAAFIEPQADQALRAMCATLGSAKAFQFRVAAHEDEASADGEMVQVHRQSTVLVRKPDAVLAQTRTGDGLYALCFAGKKLSIQREDRQQFATMQAPETIEKMLDFLFQEYDVTVPLADLLLPDPYQAFTENVQTGVYLGLHSVGDRLCHHLLFTQENVDWQVWIDSGDTPLPVKVVITHKEESGQPQYMAELSDWNLAPAVQDSVFDLKVPAGAKTVDMAELLAEKGR